MSRHPNCRSVPQRRRAPGQRWTPEACYGWAIVRIATGVEIAHGKKREDLEKLESSKDPANEIRRRGASK